MPPVGSTTKSRVPRRCQRFTSAKPVASPVRWSSNVIPPSDPTSVSQHEMLQGIEGGVPPISGFVLTTVKQNPLVEVILQSPQPATLKNNAVLASWTYGAGKAVALTTDAGNRWADRWSDWEGYDKLFSQMVRWAMRPTGDLGNFSVATNVRDGKTQVVITAVDAEERVSQRSIDERLRRGTRHDLASASHRTDGTGPIRRRVSFRHGR